MTIESSDDEAPRVQAIKKSKGPSKVAEEVDADIMFAKDEN